MWTHVNIPYILKRACVIQISVSYSLLEQHIAFIYCVVYKWYFHLLYIRYNKQIKTRYIKNIHNIKIKTFHEDILWLWISESIRKANTFTDI